MDGTELSTFSIEYPLQAVRFHKDGQTLVVAGGDSGIRIWNVSDPTKPVERGNFPTHNSDFDISRDGDRLYATGWLISDPAAWIIDVKTGQGVGKIGSDSDSAARLARVSPDGSTLATTSFNGLRFWEFLTGRLIRTITPEKHPTFFDLRADGLLVVSHYHRTTLDVFSKNGVQDVATLDAERELGGPVALTPQGHLLAASQFEDYKYHLDIWDVDQKKRLRTLGIRQGWPYDSLAFSPDGRFLATIRFEGKLEVWDMTRNIDYAVAEIPVGEFGFGCSRIRFTPDGRHVVTGNGNGTIYVVRLPDRLFN